MRTLKSAIALMILSTHLIAGIPLPSACKAFVNDTEMLSADILNETSSIASTCHLLKKNISQFSIIEDSHYTKAIYLQKVIHNLEDLKKFDTVVLDSLKEINKETKRLNTILSNSGLINTTDKESIYVGLAEYVENDEGTLLLRYIYIDRNIVLKKDVYSTKSIIKAYPLLAEKFGLITKEDPVISPDEFSDENIDSYMVASKSINVRVSPSKKYIPIGKLSYGYKIIPVMHEGKIIQENRFTKIHFEGTYAWLSSRLINKKRN